jgi:hypothetical protein
MKFQPQASAVADGPYICRPIPADGLRAVVFWIEGEVLVVDAMRQTEPPPTWVQAYGAAA